VDEMAQRVRELPGTFSAANVRQYCQQYFSVERMVADYVALYQGMVGESSPLQKSNSPITMVA